MDTDVVEHRRIGPHAASRYACTPVHAPPVPPPAGQRPIAPQRAPFRTLSPRGHRPTPQPPPSAQEVSGLRGLEQRGPTPRAHNEYVDSPQAAQIRQLHQTKCPPGVIVGGVAGRGQGGGGSGGGSGGGGGGGVGKHMLSGGQPEGRSVRTSGFTSDPVISTQPQPSGALKKDPPSVSSTGGEDHGTASTTAAAAAAAASSAGTDACPESIICSKCGKCRCHACTQRHELPQRWICNSKYECSVQLCVDVCSCVCCVKALFYHCGKPSEDEEYSASDDPCACCDRPRCCWRWTCMGLMSLCLPCLCVYWPLRCGMEALTSCYNHCGRRGCRCRRDKHPGAKRLLIDSENSST